MPPCPASVWLARHAETATPTLFHGFESDVGLSDLGRRQADAAAGWFRDKPLTAVVSSGMKRAIDTASPTARACGVPHALEFGLHERKVGALCGVEFSMTEGPWAETVARWAAGDTAYTTPGAESFDDVKARVLAAWGNLVAAHPGGDVLVVAHGVVCKVLLLSLLPGWDATGWVKLGRVANLSVTELVPDGDGWRAKSLLHVPPPVAALSNGEPTGIGQPRRSEA
jgi:broad specificity phosphatase PhoE